MRSKVFSMGAKALAVAALVSVPASASYAADFETAVATVLMGQKDGRIAELDEAKKKQLIACVNKVLADVPGAQRDYLEAAEGFRETEDRFGEIVMANQAEYKQKITKECGDLAV